MPKNERVNLRFSEDEIKELTEKADGQPLSSFCRNAVLKTRRTHRKKVTKYSDMPPDVVRNLSAIGNNLNQISRLSHNAKRNNILEVGQLLDAVNAIREDIEKYIEVSCDSKDV